MISNNNGKSLESWIWGAACSIHGAIDAPKYKDFILPLIFVKRLCDVFDDEVQRITDKLGSKEKALRLIDKDRKTIRFFIPLRTDDISEPTWSVIRKLSTKIGEQLTNYLRDIAKENPRLQGIIDRVDYNATTHGQRDIGDDEISNLIEEISKKRLGLTDVEPDIIGRSYEYLIRKFAEGGGQSAGEFYTPKEVGMVMARILDPEPGMEVYDPCCGSAGLLIKCQIALQDKMHLRSKQKYAPLQLYGQEYIANTWAMANMNMVIHDMEGMIEIGDTMGTPKFKSRNSLRQFDVVTANPFWNQDSFNQSIYENDEFDRFIAGFPPDGNADWGWMQHIYKSLNDSGRAAIILDTGSLTRGSATGKKNKEKTIRKNFVEIDAIECIILLPENLFYNTPNAGVIIIINKNKSQKEKILMINLSEYIIRDRPKNLLTDKAESIAIDLYNNWKSKTDISQIVRLTEIRDNDYNLLPSRYIKRSINPDWDLEVRQIFELNLANALNSLTTYFFADYFKKTKKLCGIENEIDLPKYSEQWELKELSEVLNYKDVRASDLADNFELPNLSLTKNMGLIIQDQRFNISVAIEDISNYKVVRKGWLVYNPMVIWEGAIHILLSQDIGVVSPAYEVWEPVDIDYRYLDFIVKSPAILNRYHQLASGGVNRRRIVNANEFITIKIPVPNEVLMKEILTQLDDKIAMFRNEVTDLFVS